MVAQLGVDVRPAAGQPRGEPTQFGGDVIGRLLNLRTPIPPRLGDRREQLQKLLFRVVGAAIEGRPSGVRKHVMGQPPCPVSATVAFM